MKKLLPFLFLACSCAPAVQGIPPEYRASIDVSCFLFAMEHTTDQQALRMVHSQCAEALTKVYVSAVQK